MTQAAPGPFELVPRRRFAGTAFGNHRSARRGQGDEVAGTRPYRPGDVPGHIDWPASARLSAARGTDEFVVREFYADEAPCVTIACDRRPGMAIHPSPSPWLDKRAAVETVVRLIAASAAAERADIAYADGATPRPLWLRAGTQSGRLPHRLAGPFDAPDRGLRLALEALLRQGSAMPTGSFVFVVSDFLVDVPAATWLRLRALCWDVVPVVVQDPLWEQTFPAIGGVVLPLADPVGGKVEDVFLTARAAHERAAANAARLERIRERFRRLGFDAVVVGTSDPFEISSHFTQWAGRRRALRRTR
jgi:uncharacterized protein (DUF58 family)